MFNLWSFRFNGTEFGERTEEYVPPFVHGTTCCALCVLSAKNNHSYEQLKNNIEAIKNHSNSKNFKVEDRDGGERNIMCIVSPNEQLLEDNLKSLGFTLIATNLPRRKGYPIGQLKMYLLSF